MWCDVMSCHVMSCHVMWCHVMSCDVMWCHVMSCDVMSCHVMWCHVMSCHVMSCDVMSCHVMWCHVMSCHVMSCHVMSCDVLCHASSCLLLTPYLNSLYCVITMALYRTQLHTTNCNVSTMKNSYHMAQLIKRQRSVIASKIWTLNYKLNSLPVQFGDFIFVFHVTAYIILKSIRISWTF